MKKNMAFLLLFLFSSHCFADTHDFSRYFQGKVGCFILFDLSKNSLVAEYNVTRCHEEISPDSTFKIPLSLMAFDQKMITPTTIFKWDGKDKGLSFWNQDQTPSSWFKNSTVWVSQTLTPQLGLNKIQSYLKSFQYGNQDFSGDPGQNNGLTRAWLSSSLKISADEQLNFLKNLITKHLPVSSEAITRTYENMYLETLPHGWKLYGKTGTGDRQHHPGDNTHLTISPQEGWFIGFLQKHDHTYIFVLNFSDLQKPNSTEAAGKRAKEIAKTLFKTLGIIT